MLAPTPNIYSCFNSGDNMNKTISLDCSNEMIAEFYS
jgi:hypothetical protein